jgi:hypothetical protein
MKFGSVINEIRTSWNLQRSYLWEAILPLIGNNADQVSKQCIDVKFGDYSVSEPLVLRWGAYLEKYSGLLNVTNITLTFVETEEGTVYNYFKAWRNLIVTPAGFFTEKENYARQMSLILYRQNYDDGLNFTCWGVWPLSMPQYTLNFTNDDIVRISIELSVDRIELVTASIPKYTVPETIQKPAAAVKSLLSKVPELPTVPGVKKTIADIVNKVIDNVVNVVLPKGGAAKVVSDILKVPTGQIINKTASTIQAKIPKGVQTAQKILKSVNKFGI